MQVAWEPQPKQHLMISCPVPDLFFGGARGGSKSDGIAGDFLAHRMAYPDHAKGLLIRRTYPELEAIEARCLEFYPATGGRWNQGRRTWFWPQGASLRLRFCENERDASRYQGHSYNWLGADELTQWASARAIDILRATVRSPHGVPCYFRGTGNPGGVGHNWVKRRYIDPAPPMTMFWDEEAKTHRIFIPSTLDDNLILLKNDPQYWQRVTAAAAGRPDLLKAWRFGLWDIVAGGMFDDLWDPLVHILAPFTIPKLWRIDRSHDWGSSKPYCTLWYAESNGEAVEVAPGIVRTYPRGTLFIIAEDYGCPPGKENEGIGGSPALICGRAKRVEERLGRKALPGPADDPLWDSTRGRAMIDEHIALGFSWLKPSKGPGSRITGWTMIRDRLAHGRQWPMEKPGLFVFNQCREFIRTFPALPRDEKNQDDVATDSEDHCFQALTKIISSHGLLSIADLVGTEGLVWTLAGWQPYSSCRLTQKKAQLLEISFTDGSSVRCTPDHLFLTETGWQKALDLTDALRYNIPQYFQEELWLSKSLAIPSSVLRESAFTAAGSISSTRENACIVPSGNRFMDQFPMGIASITATMTEPITNPRILNASLMENISPIMGDYRSAGVTALPPREKHQRSGMRAQKDEHGMQSIGMSPYNQPLMPRHKKSVHGVPCPSWSLPTREPGHAFVPYPASNASIIEKEPLRSQRSVAFAEYHLLSGMIQSAPSRRVVDSVVVSSVVWLPNEDVYCLSVPTVEHFLLANGLIAHNCGDALRLKILSQGTPMQTRRYVA